MREKKLNMSDLCCKCDLQILINGQRKFFLSQRIMSKYSKQIRKFIKQENQTTQIIKIENFPGGPEGFELISRFCYDNGTVSISIANVSLLHCCAVFLEMKDTPWCHVNLLHQTEVFLEGIFYWSWNDILTCLKSCEQFFSQAESCGLAEKLLSSLLVKIAQNSDVNALSFSSPSSSSSPETASLSSSSRKAWAWWFHDLTILSPKIIESFLKALEAYGSDNNNLVLTKFLLHYLKTAVHNVKNFAPTEYGGLADTAAHGVVSIGKSGFSCRGVFWVLRIVSCFGLSRECRTALERLIGGMLDQATLDDLLVSGRNGNGGVYDVNLVVRLIKLFVHYNEEVTLPKLKKVGELIDMYLGEIGPDPNLKVSKFLGVAESLPDCARDTFDYVYRAIDIYLQSHPALSPEERSRLCRCLNYEKLSLQACKDLAKNPQIPPKIAVQALHSQHSNIQASEFLNDDEYDASASSKNKVTDKTNNYQLVLYKSDEDNKLGVPQKEEMKVNLEKMQGRVVELEKVCREMRVQMAGMVKIAPQPRMC